MTPAAARARPPARRAEALAARAEALASARAFFASRGYLEVETPVLVPSPGLDVHLDAFAVSPSRFLSTSPEYQMKRLLGEGFERIFQITRAFRAGERGERHNPEFTILEFYRPGDVEGVLRDTEQLVARLTGGAVTLERTIDLRPPLPRLGVLDAFERFAGIAHEETLRLAHEDEDRFFETLAFTVEPALAALDRGIFLVDWPAPQASLARKKPGDPRVAERFELYVGGVELCNGFGELVDVEEQRSRLLADQATRQRLGKPVYPIDERFLDALPSMRACAGNAVGFDRVVALARGSRTIADVMAFADADLDP